MSTPLSARHLAVVPSLRQDPDRLRALTAGLSAAGVKARIVVTGRRLHDQLEAEGVEHITPRANPGFSATIHFGADSEDWDWLYIVNDDITVESGFTAAAAEIDGLDPAEHHLVFIDAEDRRPVPTLPSVITSMALLDALGARLLRRPARTSPVEGDWYKSFSCVAISRALWDALGGLDRRFPYTYEDADFTLRARALGASVHETPPGAVSHEGSGTSRRFIGRVLPVGTFSAQRYLVSRGHPRAVARAAVVLALGARVVLAPVANADLRDHLRGIATSIRAAFASQPPQLPDFEEN